MAVTSIWPIKGRVDKVINYARNPEKTHDKERLSELHEIEGVVEYAADEMKTEKRAYVTCLHLHSEETAAQEFMETKRLMHNEGGRSCYHGYQSFKADEVDADTAHSIGVALARELWGDRFQVVIATHCNTGHYHNHFVINSVSDVDGKKFYNSPADYRRMREVSDRLCREAKISVIEYPADRRANYGEWLAEKNGKPTMRNRIREDIDRAILASTTEREFLRVMKEMGYEVITKTPKGSPRVHPIVRIVDGGKNFRLDKLGEYYELDSIKQRIQNNYRRKTPFPEVAEDTKAPYYQYKEKAKKATGLYALYLYYCYELHIIVHADPVYASNKMHFKAEEDPLPEYLRPYFKRVIRITRLREVRVLLGFTRVDAPDPDADEQTNIVYLNKGKTERWLPAAEIHGEGVFIEFNRDTIDSWLSSPQLSALSQKYAQCYKEFCESKEWTITTLRDARYVLMHTFAHLLIKQMSMASGYSSSAIRERIYFGDDMSGVLLYTGSSDKEGSLGGLVELGNISQLRILMRDAFQEALVCTNDPECLNNTPAGNNSNGAACHSCCMISETACENGNRMLDRGLIVPIDGREDQAYFKALVEELCQLDA